MLNNKHTQTLHICDQKRENTVFRSQFLERNYGSEHPLAHS